MVQYLLWKINLLQQNAISASYPIGKSFHLIKKVVFFLMWSIVAIYAVGRPSLPALQLVVCVLSMAGRASTRRSSSASWGWPWSPWRTRSRHPCPSWTPTRRSSDHRGSNDTAFWVTPHRATTLWWDHAALGHKVQWLAPVFLLSLLPLQILLYSLLLVRFCTWPKPSNWYWVNMTWKLPPSSTPKISANINLLSAWKSTPKETCCYLEVDMK